MDRFEQAFWSGQSLEELYRSLSARPTHSMAALFVAAMREWKRSFEGTARSFAGLQMRIEKVMDVTIAREIERLERRLLVLATVGSAGPFIGLFGTVWGIMTSFQSIAASKNTSLAVVAPGIAEALFATAIGLVAAIPATIFYNKFVSEVNKQAQRLEGFADEFSAILSRQIDERAEGPDGHGARHRRRRAAVGKRRHRRQPVMARDQRHADGRRDAGAADHLHGGGAAAHRRRADRPAADAGQERSIRTRSRSRSRSTPRARSSCRIPRSRSRNWCRSCRRSPQARGGTDERIYVRGDRKVDYGTVMRVMGRLSAAGFRRVALVTEVEQGS